MSPSREGTAVMQILSASSSENFSQQFLLLSVPWDAFSFYSISFLDVPMLGSEEARMGGRMLLMLPTSTHRSAGLNS